MSTCDSAPNLYLCLVISVIDFTWPGRMVCLIFCVLGIALYSIPVGTLFDSFGAVIGMGDGDDELSEETAGNKEIKNEL
jgi:hypothetical protein